jgi:hypothetical protein
MPRGDKSSYTDKQKRQAEHIEEGYGNRGTPKKKPSAVPGPLSKDDPEAARRQVPVRGKPVNKALARKGGRIGGARSHKKAVTR